MKSIFDIVFIGPMRHALCDVSSARLCYELCKIPGNVFFRLLKK
jgi:hypothetical protein